MDYEKFEKILKDVKFFSYLFLILTLIGFFMDVFAGSINFFLLLSAICQFVVLLCAINGCNNETISGPICGLIYSVLLLISGSILSIIFGILLLIECIMLIKYMTS